MEHLGDLHDDATGKPLPWTFVIVGPDGVGLADAHDPTWSDQKGFADQVEIVGRALKEKKRSKAPFKHIKTGKTVEALAFPLLHEGELVGAALGIVAFVFEGRPNVLADACGVLRGGNTAIFRIGRDALATARAIMELAVRPALVDAGLPGLPQDPAPASGG